MASRYEVEITIESAKNLKNVNWRNGQLKPYVVVWIDDGPKCSTKVDLDNDENPIWDEKLIVPLPPSSRLEEAKLHVDVVHANPTEGVKPLVGSAKFHLHEVLDEAGMGAKVIRSLKLKRPSGRPHGKLEVKIAVKEPRRYYDQYAPPYGQTASREYGQQYGGGYNQYAAPAPPSGYPSYPAAAPPSGYPYGAPAPAPAYGSGSYGAPAPAYGSGSYGGASGYGSGSYGSDPYAYGAPQQVPVEQKKSKFGMGTGLAVGAAAGLVGGLALAEGIDYVEDKIEDNVADRVEDNLAYDDDGGDW